MLTVHVRRPESYLKTKPGFYTNGRDDHYYLVCERQPVTHAHIANLFWSDMTTSEALAEWHTLLPTLHNAFGAYLKSTADQVGFNYQMDHRVDLYDLQYILMDDKIPARQKLEKIRTLYRGALLAETEERNDTDFGQWLHQHRQAIQRRVGEALQGLTEYFLQQDDFVFGFKTTRWWLTLEPGNEVAHRLRMNRFGAANSAVQHFFNTISVVPIWTAILAANLRHRPQNSICKSSTRQCQARPLGVYAPIASPIPISTICRAG